MKRLAAVFLSVILLLTMAPVAWAAPGLSLSARAANEGRVKTGSWVTIVTELSNQGAELSGELLVELARPAEFGGGMRRPQYVVPLTVPSGGVKKVPVDLPLSFGNQTKVRVSFRSGGQVVADQDVTLSVLPPDATLVGVLSADELGVPGLQRIGQGFGSGGAQVVRLEADTFPSRAALLQTFSVIAISRFDSATLSKEQLRALEGWVGKGGTLLLAGGPEWKRTLAPLPQSLMPVSVTGVRDIDLAPLGNLVDKPLSGKAPVSDGQVVRGQTLAAADGAPLLVLDNVGAGKVLYVAVDPGLNPFVTWPGQGDLYDRFVPVVRSFSEAMGDTDNMFMSALQRIPALGLPSVWLVALLLGGYLVLAGPLNYYVLKRLDRREWAWVSVPLISVLFVGAVWGISMGRRVGLLSHVITVTELVPGSGTATVKTYVGLYAPTRQTMSISLDGTPLAKPLSGYYGGPTEEIAGRVVAAEKIRVEITDFNNYTMKGFSLEQDLAAKGGLELVEAGFAGGTLTGRIRNRFDQPVDGVFISFGNQSRQIGPLQAGAISEPFSLAMASAADPRMGMPMVARATPMPGGRDFDWERRDITWNATFGYGRRALPSGALVVGGWTKQPVLPANLPDLGRMYQDTNLVYAVVPIPLDPGKADIPPGFILGVPTGGKNVGRTPMGWMLPQGEYAFVFQMPRLDAAKVAEIALHLPVYNSGGYTVKARRHTDGIWVDMGSGSTITLGSFQDFVAPDGTLRMLLEVRNHMEMGQPTVSVKGVSR